MVKSMMVNQLESTSRPGDDSRRNAACAPEKRLRSTSSTAKRRRYSSSAVIDLMAVPPCAMLGSRVPLARVRVAIGVDEIAAAVALTVRPVVATRAARR